MTDYEKPCPFCGSTNLKSGGDDKIVGTWCLDCEATGPNHYGRYEWNDRADHIEELEAKLAKAVEALVEMTDICGSCTFETIRIKGQYIDRKEAVSRTRTTLAELKGQDQ